MSHNGYLSEIQVYTGQSATGEREVNLGGRVVLDLARRLVGKHYHSYFYVIHTSVQPLVKGCLCMWHGTARIPGIPREPEDEKQGKREERRLGLLKRYIQLDLQTYKTV